MYCKIFKSSHRKLLNIFLVAHMPLSLELFVIFGISTWRGGCINVHVWQINFGRNFSKPVLKTKFLFNTMRNQDNDNKTCTLRVEHMLHNLSAPH